MWKLMGDVVQSTPCRNLTALSSTTLCVTVRFHRWSVRLPRVSWEDEGGWSQSQISTGMKTSRLRFSWARLRSCCRSKLPRPPLSWQIVSAVHYCHTKNIVHRDLKVRITWGGFRGVGITSDWVVHEGLWRSLTELKVALQKCAEKHTKDEQRGRFSSRSQSGL